MTRSLLISLLLIISNSFISQALAQPEVLAQGGVTGTNANGDSQTTVVDENGNLKMLPSDKSSKAPSNNTPGMMPSLPPGAGPGMMPPPPAGGNPAGQAAPNNRQGMMPPGNPGMQGAPGQGMMPPPGNSGMQGAPGQGMMPPPGNSGMQGAPGQGIMPPPGNSDMQGPPTGSKMISSPPGNDSSSGSSKSPSPNGAMQ